MAGRSDQPVVYVSLGSFLSVRSDVLARVAEALRGSTSASPWRAAPRPASELGPVPRSWLVRAVLPQVTLLARAALAVSHGGNNSVTEALTAGVPLLLLPLSTDQFAGAAALEEAGLGEALDPNASTADRDPRVRHPAARSSGPDPSEPARPAERPPRRRAGAGTCLPALRPRAALDPFGRRRPPATRPGTAERIGDVYQFVRC